MEWGAVAQATYFAVTACTACGVAPSQLAKVVAAAARGAMQGSLTQQEALEASYHPRLRYYDDDSTRVEL